MLAWLIAQSSNPGETLGNNIKSILQGLAVPVFYGLIVCMALTFIFARQFSKMAAWIVGIIAIGIVVTDPEAIGRLANSIADAISKGV